MEMECRTETHDERSVLVVRFAGTIAPGSEGNPDAAAGVAFIRKHLRPEHRALVLDLTGLDYVMGDSVAAWVIVPSRRVSVRVAAVGSTARALEGLVRYGNWGDDVLPRPWIHGSVPKALAALPPASP